MELKANDSHVVETRSPAESRAFGACLGALLEGGDCIALIGELGAGKTTLSGGLGEGLGIQDSVTSPTYLLCCEYEGRLPLLHVDAYFDQRLEAVLIEGLAERFDDRSVLVVEWADRISDWLPADRLELRLSGDESDRRRIEVEAHGARSQRRLVALEQAWKKSQSN